MRVCVCVCVCVAVVVVVSFFLSFFSGTETSKVPLNALMAASSGTRCLARSLISLIMLRRYLAYNASSLFSL